MAQPPEGLRHARVIDHPAVAPQQLLGQRRAPAVERDQAGQEVQIGDRGGAQGPLRLELAGIIRLFEHGGQVAHLTGQIDHQHPPAGVGQGDAESGRHPGARIQIRQGEDPRLAEGRLEQGCEASEKDPEGLTSRSLQLEEAPAHPEARRQDTDHGHPEEDGQREETAPARGEEGRKPRSAKGRESRRPEAQGARGDGQLQRSSARGLGRGRRRGGREGEAVAREAVGIVDRARIRQLLDALHGDRHGLVTLGPLGVHVHVEGHAGR
ncbi:hypothetical protein D3C86_1519450 [compost metagenome]